MSALPQIFTEYKADELVQIFKGKGNGKEREEVIEILSSINASKKPFLESDKIICSRIYISQITRSLKS